MLFIHLVDGILVNTKPLKQTKKGFKVKEKSRCILLISLHYISVELPKISRNFCLFLNSFCSLNLRYGLQYNLAFEIFLMHKIIDFFFYIWEILKTWDHKTLTINSYFVSFVTHESSICF